MFVRIETGFKAEFSDPEAQRIHRKLEEIHPALAEKIRWVRKLEVFWIELASPRDKVVQAIQQAFKNPVTEWMFTGDLLPSAGGSTGSLYDLMQESPFRPGVFHGIEKRKRLTVHDEASLIVKDALQTILQRESPQDRVVTGELLILEGAKITQADLEWIAKNWFCHERSESWSLLSEDELKKNSRFQSDQVAKYLTGSQLGGNKSRLLQFRESLQGNHQQVQWSQIADKLRSPHPGEPRHQPISSDDWEIFSKIKFATADLPGQSQAETEFYLSKQQLEIASAEFEGKIQTVLGVLPEKNRLWLSEVHGNHPVRVRDEFEAGLKRVSETTSTPIVQMKVLEDSHESEPSYFWSSILGVKEALQAQKERFPQNEGSIADLFFVGYSEPPAHHDLTLVQTLKAILERGRAGQAISFAIPSTGQSLFHILKTSDHRFKYGADIIVDQCLEWFRKYFDAPMPLSLVLGVKEENVHWFQRELEYRGIPFLKFGTTTLTGQIRILEGSELRAEVNVGNFFAKAKTTTEDRMAQMLLPQPVYIQEKRVQPTKFKNRFSVEELLLKPETYHVSVSSPVIVRPNLSAWTGLMVLSDLCGQEFSAQYMEYLLRKCSAIGGQIHSVQVSMLNGLASWKTILQNFDSSYGIHITQFENEIRENIQAHWLALQLVARISDIRAIRSEDFKQVNDRIYWLPGGFDQPSTRWLGGVEGRYQGGLHSAVAIELTQGHEGMIDTLTYALLKHRLGAEVKLQHHFPSGFVVSLSENEKFAVEEEWKVLGIEFEFIGRVTASPFLVVRDDRDQSLSVSIEDLV